jgi:hypothetical protein
LSSTDRSLGVWACRLTFGLCLAYVPAMLAGFAANGGFDEPVRDPYLAIMELLILPLSISLVVVFASLHAYASASRKTLSISALALVTLMAGVTDCVHLVALTVGRQVDQATLPGFDRLLSWTWPSIIFALDIAAWDFFLGIALILGALVLTGPGLPARVRGGLLLSGLLCLAGLIGAPLGEMGLRDIGIVGYAVVLPVVLLMLGRLFSTTQVTDAT